MRLLLDTHIALWAIAKADRLPQSVRDMIDAESANVVVSVVTLWEIAIKFGNRKGRPDDMPISGAEARNHFRAAGFVILPVTVEHVLAVETLPRIHGDPFDRLLVAQARVEPLQLITHDKLVAAYSDTVLLV